MGNRETDKVPCTAGEQQRQALKEGSLTPEPELTPLTVPYRVLWARAQVGKCDLTATHKEKQTNK